MHTELVIAHAQANLAVLAKISKCECWKDAFCLVDVFDFCHFSAVEKDVGWDA